MASCALATEPLASQAARDWQDQVKRAEPPRRQRTSFIGRLFGKEDEAEQDWLATLRCRDALARDERLARRNLDVTVNQGVATLSGPVASAELKAQAEEIARGVKGIRQVENRLRIDGSAPAGEASRHRVGPFERASQYDMGPCVPRMPAKPSPAPPPPPAANLMRPTLTTSTLDEAPARASLARPVALSHGTDDRERVATLLRADPAWHAVRFRLERDELTLRGRVPTPADRDRLVRRLRGLVSMTLKDQLRIDGLD